MTPTKQLDEKATALSREVVQAFDNVNRGIHAGSRPAHAKGILLSGVFRPAASGAALTRAPHLHRESTPVSARFSDFAGVPSVADNSPDASPRGLAIRFHLAEHVHTDITAHSTDGFPARTVEEFIEFLHAAAASGPDAAKPSPIEKYLGAHPAALEFVMTPKPFPVSFATETFFAVNALKFTGASGAGKFGRYRIRPDAGSSYLTDEAAAGKGANYLMDELRQRIAHGPVLLHVKVQLAGPGDVVDDSTVHWPNDRPEIDFGTVELDAIVPENEAAQRHIIFDPLPRVDGIDPSEDPLLKPRADAYLMSGRRRRSGE